MCSRQSIECRLQWLLCLLITVNNTSGFSYPSISCEYNVTDHYCRDQFFEMANAPSTKAIYIHIENANVTANDQNQSTLNPIIEWVWVNESSVYFLQYADDFHQLTFGLLADNIFQFNMRLNGYNSFKNWNDTLYFIHFSVLANLSTEGRLCHRDTSITQTLKFINHHLVWIGYSYECINMTPDNLEITYLSKFTFTMQIITVLCSFLMVWFPIFFAITDQNKSHSKQYNHENVKKNVKHNETDHHTQYDRGDVPYGIQRFILTCFSSYPYLKVSNNLNTSSKRMIFFASFKLALVSTLVLWLLDYFVISANEYRNIPPDISEYSDLYAMPFNAISGVVGYIYFVIVLSFLTLLSANEYTYCLDIRSKSKSTFLRKIHFKRFIREGVERNILHNLINRLALLIKWQFWHFVAKISFRSVLKNCNISEKCRIFAKVLNFFICVLIFITNVLFLFLIALMPLSWTLLCIPMYFEDRREKQVPKIKPMHWIQILFFIIKVLLTTTMITLPVTQYILLFVILQYNSSPLAALAKIVKILCYLLLITVPQMSPFNFRVMLFALAVVSYLSQHARHFLLLYKSLLETIFSIHDDKENPAGSNKEEIIPMKCVKYEKSETIISIHEEKENSINIKRKMSKEHVDIEEFDYVASFTFPLRVQLFYFLFKFFLTVAFVLISLITLTGYTDLLSTNDSHLNNIISFSLILISPVLWESICHTSPQNKVDSQRSTVEQKVAEYFQNEQKRKRYCKFHVSKTWFRYLFSFCFNCFHYDQNDDGEGIFYREYKSWQMDETDSDYDDDIDHDDDDEDNDHQNEQKDETYEKKPLIPRSATIQQRRTYTDVD